MAVLMQQTLQSTLPLSLFNRLQRVRVRYARALSLAGRGDYSEAVALRSAARYVGHLMAQEARKTPDERGMRMMDLLLAVDSFLPELRGFTHHENMQRYQRRMTTQPVQAS